ncbi:MAG: hypothetical protein HY329_05360 [Chloroflexi bacterium]|nr:hypothetical protein [Chloroflexota bacterium]
MDSISAALQVVPDEGLTELHRQPGDTLVPQEDRERVDVTAVEETIGAELDDVV